MVIFLCIVIVCLLAFILYDKLSNQAVSNEKIEIMLSGISEDVAESAHHLLTLNDAVFEQEKKINKLNVDLLEKKFDGIIETDFMLIIAKFEELKAMIEANEDKIIYVEK